MKDYILTCTSTVDLTAEFLEKRNIKYVGFHYSINGVEYLDDLGQTLSYEDFYDKLKKGAETKTSQVNVDEFINFFKPFLLEGKDIFHLSLSTGISNANNSANIAKKILSEEFPEQKILIVDSLGASSGSGLFLDKLYELKEAGYSIEDLYDYAISNRLFVHHWFYSTDLSFYVKGGRITKAAGFIGTVLNLCPLLNMDNNGKLIPRYKVIGKKRVISKIVSKMALHATNGNNYDGKCFISHADAYEDALIVARKIEEEFPKLNGKVEIFSVGTTIGSHTGPGTLALFFFGDKREN